MQCARKEGVCAHRELPGAADQKSLDKNEGEKEQED